MNQQIKIWQMTDNLKKWIENFAQESNKIEGIHTTTDEETQALFDFIEQDVILLQDVENYVNIVQPGAILRDKVGLDVRVGSHFPPKGSPDIRDYLQRLLNILPQDNRFENQFCNEASSNPFLFHQEYETLHPFTDGNGRSGRAIWLWQMLKLRMNFAPGGFLQTWYYQSLNNYRK